MVSLQSFLIIWPLCLQMIQKAIIGVISITLGDAYVKNKYYVWTTSDYLSEIGTRSVYVFPFHHDVLTSMPRYSISFEMNDEERVNLLREFNIRWNYVMEYIINRFAVDNASY